MRHGRKLSFAWFWSEWEWGIDRHQFVTFIDIGPLCIGIRRQR